MIWSKITDHYRLIQRQFSWPGNAQFQGDGAAIINLICDATSCPRSVYLWAVAFFGCSFIQSFGSGLQVGFIRSNYSIDIPEFLRGVLARWPTQGVALKNCKRKCSGLSNEFDRHRAIVFSSLTNAKHQAPRMGPHTPQSCLTGIYQYRCRFVNHGARYLYASFRPCFGRLSQAHLRCSKTHSQDANKETRLSNKGFLYLLLYAYDGCFRICVLTRVLAASSMHPSLWCTA
jgi:hypothetical protein